MTTSDFGTAKALAIYSDGVYDAGGGILPADGELSIYPPILPIEPIRPPGDASSGTDSGTCEGRLCSGTDTSTWRNLSTDGGQADNTAPAPTSTLPIIPTVPAKKSSNSGLLIGLGLLGVVLLVSSNSSSSKKGLSGTPPKRKAAAKAKKSPVTRQSKPTSTHRESLTI